MSQSFRQEINIICATVTGTGTVTSSAIVQLDTTKYAGTVTYYFEAVFNGAASNTGTVKLRDIAAASNVASLAGATSATYTISRVQFTPTAGAREYTLQIVGDATRTQSVHCARIIVLQTDVVGVNSTETQIEVGNQTAALSNTLAAAITNPKVWKYTAANWRGALDFWAEVVYLTSASNTTTITLQEDDGTGTNFAATANIVVATSHSGTSVRTRARFTPADGRSYRVAALSSTTKSTYTIFGAKIIVDQTAGVGVAIGLTGSTATNVVQGGTSAAQTLQAAGQSFLTTAGFAFTRIDLLARKVNSPTDNLLLEVLSGNITNGTIVATSSTVVGSTLSGATGWVTFTFPSSSLASNTTYYLRLTRTGARDTTNYYAWSTGVSDQLPNGQPWSEDNGTWALAGNATWDAGFAVFANTIGIGNLEAQYLLLNTADSNAAGSQNYLVTWNSTEWYPGRGSITYKHAMDSDNAANACKLTDITSAADITSSTVTGLNEQVSTGLAFTDAHNLDTNVTNTTGVLAASRVLVVYAYIDRRTFVTGG